nr:site-specific integrase [uncultured Oscillibacter sp.]
MYPLTWLERQCSPTAPKKEAAYFQPEEVIAIRDALETEPLKWKVTTHLFLITGARRGEILGLKWDKVFFEENKVQICNNVLYRADRGVYEDTPKTSTSGRFIALPAETMQLLQQYKAWQNEERLRLGEYYNYQGFVFPQDNGKPMHPDSVTSWLGKFSKRHGLPHVHPHAFRHTMASLLYFNHVDSVSISKRLGHSKVSTTTDIYAHVIAAADQQNTDILADIFLKKA